MHSYAIYGPPGTGKTTELIKLANELASHGRKVAFFTFSKAAANELLTRTDKKFHVKTLHAEAFAIAGVGKQVITPDDLTKFGAAHGYTFSSNAEVGEVATQGDEYLAAYNYLRARCLDHEWYRAAFLLNVGHLKGLEAFSLAYDAYKAFHCLKDFNDILQAACLADILQDVKNPYATVEHVADAPLQVNARQPIRGLSYNDIIIDEAQDLSPLQWRFLHAMVKGCHTLQSLTVAGDDDQAIYAWAGANPHGMREEMRKYKPKDIVLPTTFRLPISICDFAKNFIVKGVKKRKNKEFFPAEGAENGRIIRQVSLTNLPTENALYLYRTHGMRNLFVDELMANNVPFMTLNGYPAPLFGKYAKAIKIVYENAVVGQKMTAFGKKMVADCFPNGYIDKDMYIDGGILDTIQMSLAPSHVKKYLLANLGHLIGGWEVTVRLSTIHGAKGLEADHVVVLDDVGGAAGHESAKKMTWEDETRVFYVAITRAKKTLTIIEGETPILSRMDLPWRI